MQILQGKKNVWNVIFFTWLQTEFGIAAERLSCEVVLLRGWFEPVCQPGPPLSTSPLPIPPLQVTNMDLSRYPSWASALPSLPSPGWCVAHPLFHWGPQSRRPYSLLACWLEVQPLSEVLSALACGDVINSLWRKKSARSCPSSPWDVYMYSAHSCICSLPALVYVVWSHLHM